MKILSSPALQRGALLIVGLSIHFSCAAAEGDLANLLGRLTHGSVYGGILHELESQPADPRIVPALRAAFERVTEKGEKQAVAATLVRLGDQSAQYFEFLAGFVREAVEDSAPMFQKYDASGHSVRGQLSAEFENWCARNAKDRGAMIRLQLYEYPQDILVLAQTRDSRAKDLFRRGLESPHPMVVGFSVRGLAGLDDVEALPVIERAWMRLPHGDGSMIGSQLAYYSRLEAEHLRAKIQPDSKIRDFQKREAEQERAVELRRIMSRESGQKKEPK